MSTMQYAEGFGVVPLRWKHGGPDPVVDGQLYLCEMWRAKTAIDFAEPKKPKVEVEARLEVHLRLEGTWMVIGRGGQITPFDDRTAECRRHAKLSGSRDWRSTIALDGWVNG